METESYQKFSLTGNSLEVYRIWGSARPRVIVPLEVVLVWTKACLTAKHCADAEPENWAIAKDEMNAMVTRILLLREPERTQSVMDLFSKLDLARSVADIVMKAQNSESAESQPVASNVVQ